MAERRGPKSKEPNELSEGVTVYIKRERLIKLGKGDKVKGKVKARQLAVEAINKDV